jgi:cytoskeletal protein RodZ
VFEIGNSLREARLRQGFELLQVEADTKIRGKYLRGLEEEQFSVLPGETYVKGFLRTYAEYLGLDGQLYVDEFNSRFAREEEPVAAAPSARPRSRRLESNLVVVALAAIVAVTVLFVIAWRYGTGQDDPGQLLLGGDTSATTTGAATEPEAPTTTATAEPARKPAKARLVLTAARGDCWLQVKVRSATGELLYEGTLQQGQSQRFLRWKRLWVQVGAPANLNVRLNGRRVTDFPRGPAIVVVTAERVRTVSTA